MIRCFILFLLCLLSFCTLSQTFFRNSYALVVGIDRYDSPIWPNLSYAVKDARAIANLLEEQDFKVYTLYNKNASKEKILTRLEELAHKITNNDRIVFFFSGHGYTDSLGVKEWGYLVPYYEEKASRHKNTIRYNTTRYISMDELIIASKKMGKARHQLFLLDACFAGLLLTLTKSGSIDPTEPNYLTRIVENVARQALTAGGTDEEVLDIGINGHSYFVNALLEAIQDGKADANKDGYVTFAELRPYILNRAKNYSSIPAGGNLPGHGLGEFVFRTPLNLYPPPPPQPVDSSDATPKGGTLTPSPVPPIIEDMIFVEGGWFNMGDTLGKEDDDTKVHRVYVDSFYICKYEVTFSEYDAFCAATGHKKPQDLEWGRGTYPVINVNWYDAIEYCNWRSQHEGLTPCYTIDKTRKDPNNESLYDNFKWTVTCNFEANGYRLPTEAEWEYAAREGGKMVRFGNGQNTADPAEINFNGNPLYVREYSVTGVYREKTMPVNSFSPNSLGLYNMSGNVWEWCWDYYSQNYYEESPKNNPKGPIRGSNRVVRGGSWYSKPSSVRAAKRGYSYPSNRANFIGFRLVRTF